MPGRAIFRVAQKERTQGVQLHLGLGEGSPGEFSCAQSLPLGALLDGRKGLSRRFLGNSFEFLSDSAEGYVYGCSERANTEGPVACVDA